MTERRDQKAGQPPRKGHGAPVPKQRDFGARMKKLPHPAARDRGSARGRGNR